MPDQSPQQPKGIDELTGQPPEPAQSTPQADAGNRGASPAIPDRGVAKPVSRPTPEPGPAHPKGDLAKPAPPLQPSGVKPAPAAGGSNTGSPADGAANDLPEAPADLAALSPSFGGSKPAPLDADTPEAPDETGDEEGADDNQSNENNHPDQPDEHSGSDPKETPDKPLGDAAEKPGPEGSTAGGAEGAAGAETGMAAGEGAAAAEGGAAAAEGAAVAAETATAAAEAAAATEAAAAAGAATASTATPIIVVGAAIGVIALIIFLIFMILPGLAGGGSSEANQADQAATAGGGTVSGNVQELARQLLNSPNVSFPLDAESPNGSTKMVLQEMAKGNAAPVTCPDGTPLGRKTTPVSEKMMAALVEASEVMPLGINTITDKCHQTDSPHYHGVSVDFECHGVPFDVPKFDAIARKYGGAHNYESCSGNDHWHYDFPAPGSGGGK